MKLMWCAALVVGVMGCGKSSSPSTGGGSGSGEASGSDKPPPPAERWKPIAQPAVSPVCAKARRYFGYGATCEEQPLPELTTAAGEVRRVWDAKDPTRRWVYALVPPTGEPEVGEPGGYSDALLRKISQRLDLATTPPETLARLWAALHLQAAVVRCLPGDVPPTGKARSDKPCAPPRRVEVDGKPMLEVAVEAFPHPSLLNRNDHSLTWYRLSLDEIPSMSEGEGLLELDPAAPLPPDAPPLPTMTEPPTWAGAATPAPADVETALCARAADLLSWKGRACKVFGYANLALPTGTLYYVANDAGEPHLVGVRTPDGAVEVSRAAAFRSPLADLVKSYDPAVVPPAQFLAAYLFIDGRPRSILCLPGAGDALPDDECRAPTAERVGDDLVVKAIVFEQPPDEPAVRAIEWSFSPGGGMSGGGTRLVDLRAP